MDKISIIKGKVVDCNGNPVTSGEVQIGEINTTINYAKLRPDGTFRYYLTCEEENKSTIRVQVFANGKISQVLDWQIKKNDINDVGTIALCNNAPTNYGVIEIGASKYYFTQELDLTVIDASSQYLFMGQSVAEPDTVITSSGSIQINQEYVFVACYMNINVNTPLNTATTIPYLNLVKAPITSTSSDTKTLIDCTDCLSYTLTKFVPEQEVEGTLSGTYKGKIVKGSFRFTK